MLNKPGDGPLLLLTLIRREPCAIRQVAQKGHQAMGRVSQKNQAFFNGSVFQCQQAHNGCAVFRITTQPPNSFGWIGDNRAAPKASGRQRYSRSISRNFSHSCDLKSTVVGRYLNRSCNAASLAITASALACRSCFNRSAKSLSAVARICAAK